MVCFKLLPYHLVGVTERTVNNYSQKVRSNILNMRQICFHISQKLVKATMTMYSVLHEMNIE
jgi:hypothetical protein